MRAGAYVFKRRIDGETTFWAGIDLPDPTRRSGKRQRTRRARNRAHAVELRDELNRIYGSQGSPGGSFDDFAAWFKATYLVPPVYSADGQKIAGLRSLDSALLHFRTVCDYFKGAEISAISYADLRDFRTARIELEGRSGRRSLATVNRELAMARRIFRVARKQGRIASDPFDAGDSLISLASEKARERILSVAEEARLLDACRQTCRRHLFPLVVAALDTGCRLGELLKMVWNDVDLERERLHVKAFNTKTMRERSVFITPRLKAVLEEMRADAALDDPVFGIKDARWFSSKRAWTTARRLAGLEDLRFHDCRHTFATRVARAISIGEVGKLLGHTNPITTFRYLAATDTTMERASAALQALIGAPTKQVVTDR